MEKIDQFWINKPLDLQALMHPRTYSSPMGMKRYSSRPSIKHEFLYGSVELLVHSDPVNQQNNVTRHRLEPSSTTIADTSPPPSSPILVENPQEETRWYWQYFLGNEHQNFAGIDPQTKTPFFMSTLLEEQPDNQQPICRTILWTTEGQRRLLVPVKSAPNATAKAILQQFPGMSGFNRSLKEILKAEIQRELIVLEDQESGVNCKFGVIYALKSQCSDTQMFSNENGDKNFEDFIKLLGQRIELKNWGSFRGGLDTSTNSTGRESVYTVFAGHEIMFHVSTMLPYSPDNVQQIERKRHVGNDIVNIVFEAGGDPRQLHFTPTMVKSNFTHVFAVVTFDEPNDCYRLWIYSKESVPAYGPALPRPNIFYDRHKFREFLLTKLINAEKAAYQAKAFVEKRKNTMDFLIKDMYVEHLKELTKKNFGKITDNVIHKLRSPVRKNAFKEFDEFCKYGELVKLEKVLCGDISRTFKVARIRTKQLWEPKLVSTNSVAWVVHDSDAWDIGVLLSTDNSGLIYLCEGLSVPVIDAATNIQQISVEHNFGILLARIDKDRDSSLIAFPLSNLKTAISDGTLLSRNLCTTYRLPFTKGCHLFATGNFLRLNLIICVGKTISLLRLETATVNPIARAPNELIQRFNQITSVNLPEEACLISTFRRDPSSSALLVAVLMRSAIAIVHFSGVGSSVHCLDWEVPRSAVSSMQVDTDEIILSYRNMTVNIAVFSNGTCDIRETFWSCPLKKFVYRFPYVLGFGEHLIEARLAINGNLLSTMYMPHVTVLSTKSEIIFAAECPTYDLKSMMNADTQSRRHSSLRRHKDKPYTPNRWNIYQINGLCIDNHSNDHLIHWRKCTDNPPTGAVQSYTAHRKDFSESVNKSRFVRPYEPSDFK